MTSHTKIKKNF